jgi:hypothetical protein
MHFTPLNRLTLGGLLLLLVSAVGCNRGPELIPVSGQVLIDGKPLTFGAIRLVPDSGRPAYSQLDSEGRFKLVTDEVEGVVQGTHAVEVSAVQAISEYQNKHHAPEKYGSAATSGLSVTVTEPTDDLKIELTWGGQRPPQ